MDHNSAKSTFPGAVPMVRIDGKKIRKLREEKKLTQLYLSTVVGVTTDTISRWENRHYQSIKLENGQKLAEALEVEFAEILQPEEQPPAKDQAPEIIRTTEAQSVPAKKTTWWSPLALVLLIFLTIGLAALFVFHGKQPGGAVLTSRVLPPHAAPGQAFPVLITVQSDTDQPVSLILTESFPPDSDVTLGVPPITSIDHRHHSLKWIQKVQGNLSTYAYMCVISSKAMPGNSLPFDGAVTLKRSGSNRGKIGGAATISVAPYHWADTNQNYEIDDEEILSVYDTYSDIEDLPFDLELIDSIWAGNGYSFDPATSSMSVVDEN